MSGSSFDIWPAHERGIRKRRGSSGKLYCANGCHSRGSLADRVSLIAHGVTAPA